MTYLDFLRSKIPSAEATFAGAQASGAVFPTPVRWHSRGKKTQPKEKNNMKPKIVKTSPSPAVAQPPLVRLVTDHAPGCSALRAVAEGRWNSPWCGIPESTVWLSKSGNKRGSSHAWLVIQCNAVGCPARKIVHSDVLCLSEPNDLGDSRRAGSPKSEPS